LCVEMKLISLKRQALLSELLERIGKNEHAIGVIEKEGLTLILAMR